jgi:ABC-type bacteriocin/lantibiotic exporter with double-glycine peptidase domain
MTLFSDYKNILLKIPEGLKGRFSLVIFLVFLAAVAEVLSIAGILPYLLIISKPAMVENSWIISVLYDISGAHSLQQFQIICLIALLVVFLLKNVFILLVTNMQTKLVYRVASKLSEIQIRNYLSLNFTDISHQNSNLIANNSMTLTTAFAHGVLNPLISLISELFILLLIFAVIIFYNFILLISILAIILPVIYFSYRITKKRVRKLSEERNKLLPDTYTNLQEMVRGFIELKLYNKTNLFIQRFLKGQTSLNQKQSKMHVLNSIPPRVVEISALIAILILSLFFKLTGGGYYSVFISIGVFGVAIYRLIPSFNRILNALMVIQNHLYVVNSMEYNSLPEIEAEGSDGVNNPITFTSEISFNKVSYSYPGRSENVFTNLDIKIRKGLITGVTGKSGEGKTTFIYLISGIIVPQKGEISIDNNPLNPNNISDWHSNIGYVCHNNFFIDGTILENITLCEDVQLIDQMLLTTAVKNASLDSFIDSLPEGVSTLIGESGVKLSEGQKQRIAIARCLYRNASVIIFDEATSAIDLGTEQEILDNLKFLNKQGKTIVIISHKSSTLSICDDLYLLKGQSVVKTENPKEFLNNLPAFLS